MLQHKNHTHIDLWLYPEVNVPQFTIPDIEPKQLQTYCPDYELNQWLQEEVEYLEAENK